MASPELLAIFAAEARERLDRIALAQAEPDGAAAIRAEAHALRGAASMLELTQIAALAWELETLADGAPDPVAIEAAIRALESATLDPGSDPQPPGR